MAILTSSARRYVAGWLGLTVALAVAVGGFNLVVDPWYLFGSPSLTGLNRYRPTAADMPERAKEALLPRACAQTLLLGNSRVESGFDPMSPAWPAAAGQVFNAAAAGAGPAYSYEMLQRAIEHPCQPALALLAVDYPDFMVPESQAGSAPPPAPQPWWQGTQQVLEATLTLAALTDAAQTVVAQLQANPRTLTPEGFNPLGEYDAIARVSGYRTLFDHKLRSYERELRTKPPVPLHMATSEPMRILARTISAAQAASIGLQLIIPPYHATFLQLIADTGRWQEFLAWKAALAREARRMNVRLLDFSVPHPLLAEPVPPAQDRSTVLRYYWEAGHFKAALGDHIIARVFGQGDFGEELASAGAQMAAAAAPAPLATVRP